MARSYTKTHLITQPELERKVNCFVAPFVLSPRTVSSHVERATPPINDHPHTCFVGAVTTTATDLQKVPSAPPQGKYFLSG